MARTVVLVAALLLLLWLFTSNRAVPALHCGDIGVGVHMDATGIAMDHGAMPVVECQAIGSVKVLRNESLASFVSSLDDTPSQDAGSVKVFRNEFLAYFVASPDDSPAQDAGTAKVFVNESLASFVASPDHDTPAQNGGTVEVISAMFSVALLLISVGIKWKTPRKVHIVLTALLLASITQYVESVELQPPPPTVVVVEFDKKIFEPTFIQARDELVVKPSCPVVDGHYMMPMEEYVEGGPVQPPPRWIRIDSTGEIGKESSAIMRGDTNDFLSFVDGTGLVHFMGLENAPLFPGAHRLPFNETYPSLFDIEGAENADIVAFLQTIPLGKSHTEAANTILSDYTWGTPARDVRGAILTYTITLGESQRIKSLGDRLGKNWDSTTFVTRDEAKNILAWDELCYKWCDQKLGSPSDNLNIQLAERGLFSIDAINNTIDLVKWSREKIGRCE